MANGVVGLVAQHRRGKQQPQGQREAEQADPTHRSHHKQQRVTGQKRHHNDAGFDKNDEKQQRIDPCAVAGYKNLQMFIDVKDEVEEKGSQFHGSDFDRSANIPGIRLTTQTSGCA